MQVRQQRDNDNDNDNDNDDPLAAVSTAPVSVGATRCMIHDVL